MRATFPAMIAAAAIFSAAAAFAADAPPANKPTLKVGDVFQFDGHYAAVDCQRWEVTAVNKDGYTTEQCGDNTAYLDEASGSLVRVVGKGDTRLVEFKPKSPTLEFPLELGKKWQGKYDGYNVAVGATWSSQVSCEAKAYEPVQVKAGTFDAYRVECTDNWESPPFRGTADSKSWYAPKLGVVVKSVNPSQSSYDYELVSYTEK